MSLQCDPAQNFVSRGKNYGIGPLPGRRNPSPKSRTVPTHPDPLHPDLPLSQRLLPSLSPTLPPSKIPANSGDPCPADQPCRNPLPSLSLFHRVEPPNRIGKRPYPGSRLYREELASPWRRRRLDSGWWWPGSTSGCTAWADAAACKQWPSRTLAREPAPLRWVRARPVLALFFWRVLNLPSPPRFCVYLADLDPFRFMVGINSCQESSLSLLQEINSRGSTKFRWAAF
jgi:hypothetical protein